ncbi:nucleotide exchange factor GrpE [Planotetraspora sp. A-T 1434]|uniref:nucleotide exchange factor GrpE n=1 Tax=Planotetraspora sp. A-T 1434 TaxID=2979219 RepID=UPI0021BDF84A|nr:nucleotide exchange factor GrpE [Planotetraspora sp. A-T 1434]MCT9933022.1 nucleotide exchange factor GrpE [Planotetraspora sp. A-T 1434]
MSRPSDSRRGGRPRAGLPPLPEGTRGRKAILAGAPAPAGGVPAPAPRTAAGKPPARSLTAKLKAELAERTADLQRVKAEYDNYRKRVQRDRLAVREIAVANVLRGLLPVLDAIARARELGQVHDGFRQVAEVLEAELAALGLRSFGEPGELFDPERHEAIFHAYSTGVDQAICSEILAHGYRVGDLLLRPAQVTVTEPAAPTGDG